MFNMWTQTLSLLAFITVFSFAEHTPGNQEVCAACQPININVFDREKAAKGVKGETGPKGEKGEQGNSCNCNLQKPYAHIEASPKTAVQYSDGQVIKDWSVSAHHSQLSGGMAYSDGKLTVPTDGRYYIYVQLYYQGIGRVSIFVNNSSVTMVQAPSSGHNHGTMYTGGIFSLRGGDAIKLVCSGNASVYMSSGHSYFGAFFI